MKEGKMKKEDIEKKLIETARNAINFEVNGSAPYVKGGTRFGGLPDVPENFEWPHFECTTWDDDVEKLRSLNFLLQINLEEFAPLDKEGLLPQKGLLSFFHVIDSDYYPDENDGREDEKCLRVFYFEDVSALGKATAPKDLKYQDESEYGVMPSLKIKAKAENSYMCFDEFYDVFLELGNCDWDDYDEVYEKLTGEEREGSSKLLGWADLVQNSVTFDLELISQGYPLLTPKDYKKVPKDVYDAARRNSAFDWVLLLQLDPVEDGDFELMYGDCGSLYVYIRREDLIGRRFEKARFMMQCC